MNKIDAERRLALFLIDDMPLIEVAARPHNVDPDWFAKYRALRRDFMRSLDDSLQELSFLELKQDEFMSLIMGNALPENITLRLRVPLLYGGKLEISNMFLCRTFPISHNLDRFIIEQSGAASIWMPDPAKKVYMPINLIGGGPGGNATEDRLAQMSAQFAAQMNHGME